MDFLYPEKQRKNQLRLFMGYLLMAAAILLMTLVLLYDAYGYSFGKDGEIIQNGLVFVSSAPAPAQIYVNGKLTKYQTDNRLQLAAGQYTLKLIRNGYRPWVRAVGVEGGSVEHFDYPLLFPTNLITSSVQNFTASPGIMSESPDRHWLLVEQPGSVTNFSEYDLTNPKQLASTLTSVDLPANVLSQPSGNLKLVSWSTDNRHLLLLHNFSGGSEYIVFDRQTPADSLNLTKTLDLPKDVQPSFINNKYDQYYLFDPISHSLSKASLADHTPSPYISHVLNLKSYGDNIVLYVTDQNPVLGKYAVRLLQDNQTYTVSHVAEHGNYLLDLAQYQGDWFVAVGASSENKVYVYKDPVQNLQTQPPAPLVPDYILKVNNPDFINFSANAQFIMVEGGKNFAVFDTDNEKGYSYQLDLPVATGQHVDWIDSFHIAGVLNGSVVVWDYDDANQQSLQPAVANSQVFFGQNYQWSYTLAPTSGSTAKYELASTSMLIPADQ